MGSPRFPSLYNPRRELDPRQHGTTQIHGVYLENSHDIYRFTLYWMFILHSSLFLLTGACAALILMSEPLRHRASTQARRRSIAYGAAVFFMYAVASTVIAVVGASVVGFLIAGVYAAGRFRVSTWIPFVWALLQTLVSVMSTSSLIIDII